MYYQINSPYGTIKCRRDYDCGKNMECLENICYCKQGFYPENGYCINFENHQVKTQMSSKI